MLTKSFVVAVAVAVLFTSPASARQSPKILDKYDCRGMGQEGQYTTPLTIERNGDTYSLRWSNSFGEGFRHENQLVAFYLLGSFHGVILYQIADGRLVGNWMFEGDDKTYTESCVAGLNAKGGRDGLDSKAPERQAALH